jgi:hypothetical protein
LADAQGIASEMSSEQVWRRMQPEAAANALFRPVRLIELSAASHIAA